MTKESFAQKMIASGVCDERGAAFCATAAGLPGGEFGPCLLAVRGHTLSVYDTDIKSRVGQRLYTIDLEDISDLSVNDSFFSELFRGYSLRFTYKGAVYTFKNCFAQKAALAVIRAEAK